MGGTLAAHTTGLAASIVRALLFADERRMVREAGNGGRGRAARDATRSSAGLEYNSGERLFLLRAIARMVGWRMAPLYVADCVLQLAAVGEALAGGLVLRQLDAPAGGTAMAVQAAGAAVLLLGLRAVGQQSSRVAHLVNLEWHRVARALELEFLWQPLRDHGLRRNAAAGPAQVGALLAGLRSIQQASAQTLAVAAAVWPAYRQLGALLAIPLGLWCAKLALTCAAACLLGQRGDAPHTDDDDDAARDGGVGEIHRSIRSIRYFGWEPLYLAGRGAAPGTRRRAAAAAAAHIAKGAVWGVLDAADDVIDHLAAGLVMLAHSRTATNGDVAQTLGLVARMRRGFLGAVGVARQTHSLVRAYRAVERFLAGDAVPTLARAADVAAGERAAARLRGCAFQWSGGGGAAVLAGVSLEAQAGELVAVCGATGSGKSALLLAVCGQLELACGEGLVTGRIGFVEQTPWVMGGQTVRANIVFGRAHDPALYAR
ncbi:ATP-binding cassette glutathione S-conjugate transporter ycf1, partial [Coemansia helicoidea]